MVPIGALQEQAWLSSSEATQQLDELLQLICEELQLPRSRYLHAVERYEAACHWIEAPGSVLAAYHPKIYPQGSMKHGTTVKRTDCEEYDLDLVCEFQVNPTLFIPPMRLLKLVEARFREHKSYASILELKNRCLRLNYANEFHMDILPACPDVTSGGSCLVVPDRKSQTWKASNPKGYADWFESRCAMVYVVMAERARMLGKAEPVPEQESVPEKAILKRLVQLLKRWRDLKYRNDLCNAPISMVLTTLAAAHYQGQLSVADALSDVLAKIVQLTETSAPRIYVLNPANSKEDLSERWNDPAQYRAFVKGIRELHQQWHAVVTAKGIPNLARQLLNLFGEPVNMAITKQAKGVQTMRAQSALRASSAGLLSTAPAVGIAMRSNTFHGI